MKVVKVISKEVKDDKNGRPYALLTLEENFSQMVKLPSGETILAQAEPKVSRITASGQSYLNDKPEFLFGVKEGSFVLGGFETRIVTPYDITDPKGVTRTVNTATVFVAAESEGESWSAKVQTAFKQKGFILDSTPIKKEEIKEGVSPITQPV